MIFDEDPFDPSNWSNASTKVYKEGVEIWRTAVRSGYIWEDTVFALAVKQKERETKQSNDIRNDPYLLKKRREMQKRTDRSNRKVHNAPKPCEICHVDYTPYRKDQKYCGAKCRKQASLKEKPDGI